jgi:hypothetical protein
MAKPTEAVSRSLGTNRWADLGNLRPVKRALPSARGSAVDSLLSPSMSPSWEGMLACALAGIRKGNSMSLRTKIVLTIGTFALGMAAPAFAAPPQGSGTPAEKGKPAGKAHEEKGKPADMHHEGKGKPEHADGKDKAAKDKAEKDEEKSDKAAKDDKHNPGDPPGLAAKRDEHHKKLLERFEERKRTMKDRGKSEREESRRRLGAKLGEQGVQQELRRHAMMVARIERIKEIADADERADLSARATATLEKENARHAKRVAALSSKSHPVAVASGGAP